MAEGQRPGNDSLLDMEKELTCSICTDILYQPLTLLDCLHTFCGSCLKEWFASQSASTLRTSRPSAHPYTCPSCRDSVRATKADWRLTALLEAFLKVNPDRLKSDAEKEGSVKVYKPGDDVIPRVEIRRDDTDSEDERLMAEVRDLSMANVDPETARRRAERARGQGRDRRRQDAPRQRPEELGRSHQRAAHQAQLSEERLRQHNAQEPHVEHQPSLRSLLSASPVQSHDVQQEILQSIYADGLLDGIDIDNLTPEQEDQLTERIARAYRRRQRRRERSRSQDYPRIQTERSPQPATAGSEGQTRSHTRTVSASAQHPRARPPVSRPHLFEQQIQPNLTTRQQRSISATSQRSNLSASRAENPVTPAARSATDLSDSTRTEEGRRERHRRMSSNARSTTDPEGHRVQVHRMRTSSGNTGDAQSVVLPTLHPLEAIRRQAGPTNNSSPSLPTTGANPIVEAPHTVRPAASPAAFAPEPVIKAETSPLAPTVNCHRCGAARIQHDLHYHCAKCRNGTFNICQPCYREGQGCDHWYGFGFKADERFSANAPTSGWPAEYERPHVLAARRYPKNTPNKNNATATTSETLQEGAFCESCAAYADQSYWYCLYCLEGAWGYCDRCVQQGRHCSHPLLPVTALHTTTLSPHAPHQQNPADPRPKTATTKTTTATTATFVPMPHLPPSTYILSPPTTACDLCALTIPPHTPRFHCFACGNGDYDVCADCYSNLVTVGKVNEGDGEEGWRRCGSGHRMAVVGFVDVLHGGGARQRVVLRDGVGGWRYIEGEEGGGGSGGGGSQLPGSSSSSAAAAAAAEEQKAGLLRCRAMYSYFPRGAGEDDLGFPKNAEIGEVKEQTAEWFSGVYCGKLGLFPSSHVRKLANNP
ncbi:hypothetical protein LTR33_003529 [Friedmanniomyces endolithicus]|nr:hypothetical protein LTR33_003529 [Friedmanniomyces endolithicus]